MKISALILAALFCLATVALAEKDSIIVGGKIGPYGQHGPYKVSFDLGVSKDSYNKGLVSKEFRKIPCAGNSMTFIILLSSKTNYTDNKTDSHAGYQPYAMIMLDEYNYTPRVSHDKESTTCTDCNTTLSIMSDENPSVDIARNKTVNLSIDKTIGKLTSSSEETPGRLEYQAKYRSAFYPPLVYVTIRSTYPWDNGTRQLLDTIHVGEFTTVEKLRAREVQFKRIT